MAMQRIEQQHQHDDIDIDTPKNVEMEVNSVAAQNIAELALVQRFPSGSSEQFVDRSEVVRSLNKVLPLLGLEQIDDHKLEKSGISLRSDRKNNIRNCKAYFRSISAR